MHILAKTYGVLTRSGTCPEESLELDDNMRLAFKLHDVGLAKTALLVMQATRYTCSIAMSVGNCYRKIDEVGFKMNWMEQTYAN